MLPLTGHIGEACKVHNFFVHTIDEIPAIFFKLGAWGTAKPRACLLPFSDLKSSSRKNPSLRNLMCCTPCRVNKFSSMLLAQILIPSNGPSAHSHDMETVIWRPKSCTLTVSFFFFFLVLVVYELVSATVSLPGFCPRFCLNSLTPFLCL